MRRGCRRESLIHESTNSLLTTPLCCNAVNSLNQPEFQREKGPGSGFIRLSMMSERRHGEQRPCRVCRAGLTAPIVSRVIPTPADSPPPSPVTAQRPRGGNAAPQQLGDLTGEERGEERCCTPCQHPSLGIIPAGGQKPWAGARSQRREPHGAKTPIVGLVLPKHPSTQALVPRPEPHASEAVPPLPAQALGWGGSLSATFGSWDKGVTPRPGN